MDATNNVAERPIRGIVIVRKVWGGNRTWGGACTQQILVSVLRACRQQGKDAFTLCVRLLRVPRAVILAIPHRMPESPELPRPHVRPSDLELMRHIAQESSGLGVTEIARTVCELLERTSGRLWRYPWILRPTGCPRRSHARTA